MIGGDPDDPDVEIVLGTRNSIRFEDYARLDLRATKRWPNDRGGLTLILEIINLTNRDNQCCVTDLIPVVDEYGGVEVVREFGYWAPFIPSASLRWQF